MRACSLPAAQTGAPRLPPLGVIHEAEEVCLQPPRERRADAMKHMSIAKWLNQLGLPEYCPVFDEEYDGVEDLLHLTESDLQELGVLNHVHRVHMLSSIHLLREQDRRKELKMMTEGKFATLPRNLHMARQCSLASSMDLLSIHPSTPQTPTSPYQAISIHGTLPRRKKGSIPIRSWDQYNRVGMPTHPACSHLPPSPLVHNIIEEHPSPHHGPDSSMICKYAYDREQRGTDPTMEYVKFSKEKYIMEGPPEKLRKELEEELKMGSEEPRSHAWYHGTIPRQVADSLVQRDGDFLIRDSLSSPGDYVLTCQWKNVPQHFKINKQVVAVSEAFSRVQYLFERVGFDSVPALVRYYVGNRKPVSEVVGAIIFQPINRTLPLRCLEEKYSLISPRPQPASLERKSLPSKRLSLNLVNGHAQEHTFARGNLLRNKDKCGSQPACLNHVQERRRPLKTHQSESFLPLGSRPKPQSQPAELQSGPKSPVFRTGSEPVLSPTMPRRSAFETDRPIRGSDSMLCPKPPPKPSKTPSIKLTRPHHLQPTLPPKKPQQAGPEAVITEPQTSCTYVERLREETPKPIINRSSYHNAIEALQDCYSMDAQREEKPTRNKPVFETVSAFRPGEFQTCLLPPENKPLEMSVLRRAKELLVSQDHRTIAQHLLLADCQVARILNVTEELKCQMGVTSGLELITLPHGKQLRLDLMERHNTMVIGVAVDILGCTGSLEERAATLHRIILVAKELKDCMRDLYAFSAIMKALDMPQITRLDHTWTTLRRKYTQTAILYEKSLKPFFKELYEGSAGVVEDNTTVPLLMPLLTLMERPAAAFENVELWESNDQGCEIMLRHLEEARRVAHNTDAYRSNAEHLLQDFHPNEELLEIFKTDFQLRLLWGSRGAAVDQTERYDKFKLILTALSKKLEPTVRHTEL